MKNPNVKKPIPLSLILKVLQQARRLVSKRGGWIQGVEAERRDGHSTNTGDPKACKFCTYGAVEHSAKLLAPKGMYDIALRDAALQVLRPNSGISQSIVGWNDDKNRTQLEVVMAFDFSLHLLKDEMKGALA